MARIMTEVYVPSLEISLDVVVPTHITISKALKLIAKIIYKKEKIKLETDSLLLYLTDTGEMLHGDELVSDTAIVDAVKLIMF